MLATVIHWYQHLGWMHALLLAASVGGGVFIAILWRADRQSPEYQAFKRKQRLRIRVSAQEIDAASITGQFYVPYGQTDKKGVTKL